MNEAVATRPDGDEGETYLRSNVQRGVLITGGSVRVGTGLKQQHDDVGVTQSTGDVQRRLQFSSLSIHLKSYRFFREQ